MSNTKQIIINALKYLVGIALGAIFLYLTLKDRPLDDILSSISEADVFYIVLSGLFLLTSHVFRALRWQLLLKEAESPAGFWGSLNAVLVCYGVNALTPRLGEIARCSVLYQSDNVPVNKGLGTVVTERATDMLVLLGSLSIIFLVEYDRLQGFIGEILTQIISYFSITSLLYMALAAVIGALLLFYFIKKQRTKNNGGLSAKIYTFIQNFWMAIKGIVHLKNPILFIAYTILLWFFLVLLTYTFLLALPGTRDLGFYFAVVVFFIGGLGWIMPVPNGMGPFHYVVWQVFLLWGLDGKLGQDFALVDNGATWIVTIILGAASYLIYTVMGLVRTGKG